MQPSSVLIFLRRGATYYFMDMSAGEAAAYIQHIKDMGFTKDAEKVRITTKPITATPSMLSLNMKWIILAL